MSTHEAERANGENDVDPVEVHVEELDSDPEDAAEDSDQDDEQQSTDHADDEIETAELGAPADESVDDAEITEKVHFDADEPLLPDAESYRTRWLGIQTGFVDEPLYAVESAGRLLTEVLGDLASTFAQKRGALERQWRHGGDTSTDDLRVAFQNYRAFFNRVVST